MERRRFLKTLAAGGAAALGPALWPSCSKRAETIVVYAAVDREVAEPALAAFTKATGIAVDALFDSEAAKTVGLAKRIEIEKDRPRADVFWSGESFFTARLARAGAFEAADAWRPAAIHRTIDAGGEHWVGFGARLRVLVHRGERAPAGLADLGDPAQRGRVVFAGTRTGTAATHALHLATSSDGRAILEAIAANRPMIVAGNGPAARAVKNGGAAIGLTDNDDFLALRGDDPDFRVAIPDQGPGGRGAVLLTASVAVVKSAPNPEAARRFAAWVSGAAGEEWLAANHWPLAEGVAARHDLPALSAIRLDRPDVDALAGRAEELRRYLDGLFHA